MSAPLENWTGLEVSGGRYQVLELLGSGGMADVYRALDRNLESDVVLKVPRRTMLADPAFVKRFRAEIRSLVKLRHPHVVSVLDVGGHDGVPFAVLQHLSGGTLTDLCAKRLTSERLELLCHWLPPIAQAIDFLHKQGFVHRDIKPDNILFDDHKHAYLSDFGVVKTVLESEQQSQTQKLTRNGILGTPEYMAPEMILGKGFDGRVDQYAMGITVYEIIAKRSPFAGEVGTAILIAHAQQEAPNLGELVSGLPDAFVQTVHRSIQKDPQQRFQSCEAFAANVVSSLNSSGYESSSDLQGASQSHVAGKVEEAEGSIATLPTTETYSVNDTVESKIHPKTTVSTEYPQEEKSQLLPRHGLKTLAIVLAGLILVGSVGGFLVYRSSQPSVGESFFLSLNELEETLESIEQQLEGISGLLDSKKNPMNRITYRDLDDLKEQRLSVLEDLESKLNRDLKKAKNLLKEASFARENCSVKLRDARSQGDDVKDPTMTTAQLTLDGLEERIFEIEEQIEDYRSRIPEAITRYENAFDSEVNTVVELQRAWGKWESHWISPDILERAKELSATHENPTLKMKALAVVLQDQTSSENSNDYAAQALSMARALTANPESASDAESATKLCFRAINSPDHFEEGLTILLNNKLWSVIPPKQRIVLINRRPDIWGENQNLDRAIKQCESDRERFELFKVQCQYQESRWVREIRASLLRRTKSNQRGTLFGSKIHAAKLIMESRWADLYDVPIYLAESGNLSFSDMDNRFLDHLTSVDAAQADYLGRVMLKDPSMPHVQWALQPFLVEGDKRKKKELLHVLRTSKRIGRVLNVLFEMNTAKSLAMAQSFIIDEYKEEIEIDYKMLDFSHVDPNLREKNEKFYQQLSFMAWKSGVPQAQQWVAPQVLPEETLKYYRVLEAKSQEIDRQCKVLLGTFNDANSRIKKYQEDPFPRDALISFPIAKVGNRENPVGVWLSELNVEKGLEHHQAILAETLDDKRKLKYYTNMESDVERLKNYFEAYNKFAKSFNDLVGVGKKLEAKEFNNRIYMLDGTYKHLKRVMTEVGDRLKKLQKLEVQMQWIPGKRIAVQ